MLICYVVTDADDKVVSISTDTSFKPAEGTCGKFTVKAVNEYGSLSEGTTYETTTGINGTGSETTVKEDIYNTSGMKLGSAVKGHQHHTPTDGRRHREGDKDYEITH